MIFQWCRIVFCFILAFVHNTNDDRCNNMCIIIGTQTHYTYIHIHIALWRGPINIQRQYLTQHSLALFSFMDLISFHFFFFSLFESSLCVCMCMNMLRAFDNIAAATCCSRYLYLSIESRRMATITPGAYILWCCCFVEIFWTYLLFEVARVFFFSFPISI